MIRLIDKQKIIIAHFREGKSQRQIERETGITRKTIRKYINEYEEKKNNLLESKDCKNTELIEDIVEKPRYDTSKRNKVKLTGKIISRIKSYLAENEEKRASGRAKENAGRNSEVIDFKKVSEEADLSSSRHVWLPG